MCFKPKIGLFATNINTNFDKYEAVRPDPGAIYIDPFTIDWSDLNFYAFIPISAIPRAFSKAKDNSEVGIIAVQFWPAHV